MKDLISGWLGISEESEEDVQIDPNRAAAALMVEVMAIDNEWAAEESTHIQTLLQTSLGLTEADAKNLLDQAQSDHAESVDLYQYTSVINKHYDPAQKLLLLERLWTVAYADGQIDRYEEHMLRKLADLLHLPHSKYIQAKLAAREQMESS